MLCRSAPTVFAPQHPMNCAATAAKAALLTLALIATTSAGARIHHKRAPREVDHPPPAVSVDKRDVVVAAPGPFNGQPYWLALAQCGGIYFELNTLYTDAAVHARVVKPDPKANAQFTTGLKAAIKIATVYFDSAEHFLMNDRGIERDDAVLTYDPQSRAEGDRFTTIDSAVAAAKACPALYRACQAAHPKVCNEPLLPESSSLPQGAG
ncbi:MAG TPA: hypothetical protein VGJ20_34145 [Xanthobacteraceae bacterium]